MYNRYLEERYKEAGPRLRKLMLPIYVVEIGLGIMDFFLLQEYVGFFLFIRLVVFNVVLAVAYIFSYRDRFAKYLEDFATALVLISTFNVTGIIFFGEVKDGFNHESGLLILMMMVFTMRLISHRRGLFLLWTIVLGYNITAVLMPVYDLFRVMDTNISLAVIGLLGYYAAKERDTYLEREFRQQISLAEQLIDKQSNLEREESIRLKAEDSLEFLKYHDAMTGVFNRNYLDVVVIPGLPVYHYPIAIHTVDINGLKLINNALGHSAGDQLLLTAVDWIKKDMPEHTEIIRSDGDEFTIISQRVREMEAKSFVEGLRKLSETAKEDITKPSISIGSMYLFQAREQTESVLVEVQNKLQRDKLIRSESHTSHILSVLKGSLREKTHETAEHVARLEQLAEKVGKQLGLSYEDITDLVLAASIHDIGKIVVPTQILEKEGKLTPEEWEIIKRHPQAGQGIAMAVQELSHVAEYILHHHERMDGTGYPDGLKGEEIPFLSRIISVIDAYDVMLHERAYKEPMSKEEAKQELRTHAGTQFDATVVEALLTYLDSPLVVEKSEV